MNNASYFPTFFDTIACKPNILQEELEKSLCTDDAYYVGGY